jgi:hypothetical protein
MSRDVTWLNKTFGEFKKIVGVVVKPDIVPEEEEAEREQP